MTRSAPIQHFLENPSRSFATLRYRIRESWRRQTAHIHPNPSFIFGNQKSGTSAITALLGEATGLSYTIDILCLYEGLEDRLLQGKSSFEEVIQRGRYYFSKDIIKDPGFTFFYKELINLFPNSKRVFVLRDPRQNIRSILNRLDLPGHLENLSSTDWLRIKEEFPGWYSILKGDFSYNKGTTYIETLAHRCHEVFHIYLKNKEDFIPIYYEKFNQDKVNTIYQLAAQLELKIMYPIEHLKDKQFQPKGNKNIAVEDFFGVQNLQCIEDICGAEMVRLGYDL